MKVIGHSREVYDHVLAARAGGQRVALVPTMGYFHAGHASLMRHARTIADHVVVSLFVNPAQFAPHEDLNSYPRDFERDMAVAQAENADVLFAPEKDDVYLAGHATWIDVPDLGRGLCGRSRPGHFRGVCTVVCKLFNIVRPHVAVFGQKDWQQLAIVRRMTADLNMDVEIVGRPIVREADGLAMSSRNVYLTPEERSQAPGIYEGLKLVRTKNGDGIGDCARLLEFFHDFVRERIPLGRVDYAQIVDPVSLADLETVSGPALLAVSLNLGRARLIDNILIRL